MISEPPAPSEPRDSSSVATTMPRYSDSPPAREAAVLLGHRQAEAAHLGEPADDVLGDVGVVAVDVLGDRLQLLVGEAAERVLHELEVVVEMAGAVVVGERRRGTPGSRYVATKGAARRARRARCPTSASRPNDLGRQLGDGVGDERAGDAAFEVALGAVVEQRPCGLDGGGGVGEVVGEDLVVVDRSGGGERRHARVARRLAPLDGRAPRRR